MLSTTEMITVMQAYLNGQKIESSEAGYPPNWEPCPNPVWDWYAFNYRVKPLEGLTIPWAIIKPEFKWAAADEDGGIFVYDNEPASKETKWIASIKEHSSFARADHLINVKRGEVDWKDSLVRRPD